MSTPGPSRALNHAEVRTFPVAITTFLSAHQTGWSLVFAAALIAVVLIVVAFIAGRRFFIRDLATGGAKG